MKFAGMTWRQTDKRAEIYHTTFEFNQNAVNYQIILGLKKNTTRHTKDNHVWMEEYYDIICTMPWFLDKGEYDRKYWHSTRVDGKLNLTEIYFRSDSEEGIIEIINDIKKNLEAKWI